MPNKFYSPFLALFVLALLYGCSSSDEEKIRIGFAQAMSTDDWRKNMNTSMEVEASLHDNVELTITDAGNDDAKQVQAVEQFIKDKVDVIIVSPIQSKPLTPVVAKAFKAGIPVLVVDRKVEGEDYTAYLGGDNIEAGRNAARYIYAHHTGSGQIIEITGQDGSSPAFDRHKGFAEALSLRPKLKVVGTIHGNWEASSVPVPLEAMLKEQKNLEYIFAHNDRMAYSAWQTAKKLGLEKKIKFIGIDALNTPDGGIELVNRGVLQATLLYPPGGGEAVKLAIKLYHKEPVAKQNIFSSMAIDKSNVGLIQSQLDKEDSQQSTIDEQQKEIKEQAREYASQSLFLNVVLVFVIIILALAVYSIYSARSLRRKKKELEEINRTVTEQKEEIETMAAIARQSTEAKLHFFTGLSHEFKTPITLILSYAESLLENDTIRGTKLESEMKLIFNNSNRLLRLVNQLLDFRKIEEKKFTLRASKTNICDFTQEIMENFKAEAARRSIVFNLTCENSGTELFIDRNLMDKVYFNLLSNAFKFTPDKGRITIFIKETSFDSVKICFKDSGIGIPEHEARLVFSPFFKGSNNTKNSSGIGLHISREFVLLHHGKMEVKSDEGSEFIITLPKGSSHLEPEEIVEKYNTDLQQADFYIDNFNEDAKQGNGTPQNNERHTLLIIEDNSDLVYFLRSKLSAEFDIHTSDGSDAIDKAFEIVPDIIVCDVNLTDKDGFEISGTLKKDERTSHIPIIILTAQSNKESIIKGLKSGVDQYLTKPFSLAILKQSINNLLFNRQKLNHYYTNSHYKAEPDAKFVLSEQSFVSRMNDIIRNNISDDGFTVEDLAASLNLSRVQLYRKVKAILGISISDHINNIRLERAAELLKNEDTSINEIAESLGFSSSNYFSTAFKNKFGNSPTDYRNNNKNT